MAISGTVPYFSTAPVDKTEGAAVVTVTGLTADGQATGALGSEGLPAFYVRCMASLGGITGAEAVSGDAAADDGVLITSGQLSGIMQLHREMCYRAADLAKQGQSNAARLDRAQTFLAVNGETGGLS